MLLNMHATNTFDYEKSQTHDVKFTERGLDWPTVANATGTIIKEKLSKATYDGIVALQCQMCM